VNYGRYVCRFYLQHYLETDVESETASGSSKTRRFCGSRVASAFSIELKFFEQPRPIQDLRVVSMPQYSP
jgi:hypothetical protein